MAPVRNPCVPFHLSPFLPFTPLPIQPQPLPNIPPIMSTTTQDTSNPNTRHTLLGLQLPSPQIHKGLVSFLHSAFLLLPLETTAGKAPATVRWVPTSPTMPTSAPPPQPILPSTPSSSLIPRTPIPLCPIHAITLPSSLPSITPINYP